MANCRVKLSASVETMGGGGNINYNDLMYRLHLGQYLLHQELVGGVGAAGAVGTMGATGAVVPPCVKIPVGISTVVNRAVGEVGTTGAVGATGAVGGNREWELQEQREL